MIVVVLLILGLSFGSFALALVDRVHAKKNWVNDRSVCEYCGHVLSAGDLVPVFSWLALRGHCRYCKHSLSWQYPLTELLSGLLFSLSYLYWPVAINGWQVVLFMIWLVLLVLFVAMTVYDFRWMLLPNGMVYTSIGLAMAWSIIQINLSSHSLGYFLLTLGALLVSSGVFYLLFQLSEGKWIGGGDVKLGVTLGLLAGNPLNAALMLFIASVLGTIYSLPVYINSSKKPAKKPKKFKPVPFGPFLMLAAVIVVLFGQTIINWYTLHFLTF